MEANSPSPSPTPIVVLLIKNILKDDNMADVETVGYKHEYLIHVFHNRIEQVVSCWTKKMNFIVPWKTWHWWAHSLWNVLSGVRLPAHLQTRSYLFCFQIFYHITETAYNLVWNSYIPFFKLRKLCKFYHTILISQHIDKKFGNPSSSAFTLETLFPIPTQNLSILKK
jgi:hypothetical protein